MSKEPSMEEILSSIKRIIAEEGDEASRGISARAPRRSRPVEEAAQSFDIQDIDGGEEGMLSPYASSEEVLELTDPFDLDDVAADSALPSQVQSQPMPVSSPAPEAPVMAQTAPKPAPKPAAPIVAPAAISAPESAKPDTILSVESEVATRHSLSALSAMVVKPQGEGNDNTLESLVRELLRPMMKDWLDAHLPDLVEAMVAKEIARITGRDL